MMLIEQSVAPLQFVRLEQSHLQAVQDDLILGAGHPKFFAHAPKLEKSEGACPAKRVYAFPLNYLHGVMDWRCRRLQDLVNSLRGDLDCIVLKCLEKDRSRRYETANGL